MGANQTKIQTANAVPPTPNTTTTANEENKQKCKPCCACPDTKRIRDECVILNGEENCGKEIEAHKACMRAAGFNI